MSGFVVRGVHFPESAIQYTFTASGGPGGQHANTSNTAVQLRFSLNDCVELDPVLRERIITRLRHRMTDNNQIVVAVSKRRSQTQNRDEARHRLIALLDEGIKPPPKKRVRTRPSRAAQRRRVDAKKRRGQVKAARRKDWRNE